VREEHRIIIVLELVAKAESVDPLKLVLEVVDVPLIEGQIHGLCIRPDGLIVVEVLDVEAGSVPLLTVAFSVSFSRIDEGLHALRIETIVFHEVHHV